MRKLLFSILLCIVSTAPAWANQKYLGKCAASGAVLTSGLSSTNTADLTYASAAITVNVVGGGLATIFSDNSNTPLSNPFTANTDATFAFYAANGHYTAICTGVGVPNITISDILLNDPTTANSYVATFFSTATSNPALTGIFRMASVDAGPCWRNNANSADLCFTKSAGDILNWPTAMSVTGSLTVGTLITGQFSANLISPNPNPATTGFVRAASSDLFKIRNNANSLDLNLLSKNSSDVVAVGDTAGVSVQGMTNSGSEAVTGGITAASVAASGTVTGSNIPASIPGTGSCTNQFVTALNTLAAPTCTTDVLASAQHVNQGTVTTVLHGNAAGNPGFSSVAPGDTTGSTGTGTTFVLQASPTINSPTLVTPNIGVANGTSLSTTGPLISTQGQAQASSGVQIVATTPFMAWDNAGQIADNKWWDCGSLGLQFWCRVVNDANNFANVWLSVTRSGVAVPQINLPNTDGTLLRIGAGGLSSFDITNTSTAIPSRRGMTLASDPAGDVTWWFNSTQTGAGHFWRNGATGVVQARIQDTGDGFAALRMGTIRWAHMFSGADCGAKINGAVTDFGGLPGEIWVNQNCGTTISTAVSIPANVTLRFVQGGTYSASAAITLGQGSILLGPGCGGNLCSTVIQEAAGANLPSLVNMGNQSSVIGLALDGNKTNNPTGGVGLKFSLVQQTKVTNALIQNFKSMGVNIASTLSGDEAASPVFDNVLLFSNDGGGMQCSNTTDGFMSKTQYEQNGLGPTGGTVTLVNTAGTSMTWVSGPKWSTDSSLIGTNVRFASQTVLFQVATIPSTTTFTTTTSFATASNVQLFWGDGMFANNCPGWRYEHSDFGGNGNDGLLLMGSDTGRGSGQNMIVGNEFGGNRAHDVEERGFGTAVQVAINNTFTANTFLGSSISPANIFSDMYMVDPSDDVIVANVFRPANRKFGVDFEETASGRAQRTVLVANSFINGFGTGAFSANTALASNALAVFANAEGAGAPSTFGMGPGSIKFQGGITNSGTGHMHVRATSCTTAAAANANCTTTITWPGTWNDTSYTATCSVAAPNAALGVGWLGAKSTTTLQVQVLNLAGSAAAATGEIDCIADHD